MMFSVLDFRSVMTRAVCWECHKDLAKEWRMIVDPRTGKGFCDAPCQERHNDKEAVMSLLDHAQTRTIDDIALRSDEELAAALIQNVAVLATWLPERILPHVAYWRTKRRWIDPRKRGAE